MSIQDLQKKAETGLNFRFQFLPPHSLEKAMKPLSLLFLNIIFSELKFCHYGNIAKKFRYILIKNFIKKILIRRMITAF
ncbi:hypothetical protein B4135_0525 [Caldibacillus debilis]|uniref:Uncharacterized protein n=1 Tax=Caldibacillus debilis TaxID=301148 RepID=A0A150M9D6_9BACI|nr:hypothetical protein B4135_0525 [Caldibacillus debilis]